MNGWVKEGGDESESNGREGSRQEHPNPPPIPLERNQTVRFVRLKKMQKMGDKSDEKIWFECLTPPSHSPSPTGYWAPSRAPHAPY